jgi:hypothetical protein
MVAPLGWHMVRVCATFLHGLDRFPLPEVLHPRSIGMVGLSSQGLISFHVAMTYGYNSSWNRIFYPQPSYLVNVHVDSGTCFPQHWARGMFSLTYHVQLHLPVLWHTHQDSALLYSPFVAISNAYYDVVHAVLGTGGDTVCGCVMSLPHTSWFPLSYDLNIIVFLSYLVALWCTIMYGILFDLGLCAHVLHS